MRFLLLLGFFLTASLVYADSSCSLLGKSSLLIRLPSTEKVAIMISPKKRTSCFKKRKLITRKSFSLNGLTSGVYVIQIKSQQCRKKFTYRVTIPRQKRTVLKIPKYECIVLPQTTQTPLYDIPRDSEPSVTPSATPGANSSATPTHTATAISTATKTATPTATNTVTPTSTKSQTPTTTPTTTVTPGSTPTRTATPTVTRTLTPTASPTPTNTPKPCQWTTECCLTSAQLNMVQSTGTLNLGMCQLFSLRFHGSTLNAQPVIQSGIDILASFQQSNQISHASLVIPSGSYSLNDGLRLPNVTIPGQVSPVGDFEIRGTSGAMGSTRLVVNASSTITQKSVVSRKQDSSTLGASWATPLENVALKFLNLTLAIPSTVSATDYSVIDFTGMANSTVSEVSLSIDENKNASNPLLGTCRNCSGIFMKGKAFTAPHSNAMCSRLPFTEDEPVVDASSAYCNLFDRMTIIGGGVTALENRNSIEQNLAPLGGFIGVNLQETVSSGASFAPGFNIFSGGRWRIASALDAIQVVGIRNYFLNVGYESVAGTGIRIGSYNQLPAVRNFPGIIPIDPCRDGLGNVTPAMAISSGAYTCVEGGYHEGWGTSEPLEYGKNVFSNSINRTKIGSVDDSALNHHENQRWSAWLHPNSYQETSRSCTMGNQFAMASNPMIGCTHMNQQNQVEISQPYSTTIHRAIQQDFASAKATLCDDATVSQSIKNGLGCS